MESLAPSLMHLPALRRLCLSRDNFKTSTVEALAPCLRLLTGLQHLDIHSSYYFAEDDDKALETFAACLAGLTGLQHLAGVRTLGDDESAVFAPCLKSLTALRHLDMCVGKGGAVALAPSLRCLTTLQHLVLVGEGAFIADPPGRNMGGAGGAVLAASLRCLTGLQHLKLESIRLGDDGVAALAPVLSWASSKAYNTYTWEEIPLGPTVQRRSLPA